MSESPRKRAPKGSVANPPIPNSDLIRLPDGREYSVADLVSQSTRPRIHNLKSPRAAAGFARKTQGKYTMADRLWQSESTVEAIAERYQITRKKAQGIRYSAVYIVKALRNSQKV